MNGSDADKQAFYLLKKVNKAIRDHHMVAEDDRIAVAVSGGKDSLSLLRLLHVRQASAPDHADVIALHVRRDVPGSEGPDPLVLQDHLQQEGLPYHFLDMGVGDDEPLPLDCFRCAWHRRKALFEAAHRLGCNKLALGHHADDVAHTTLLNLFYHGRLNTMQPRVSFFDDTIVVIRPLLYVSEKELVRFARACGFPLTPGCCELGAQSARQKMRELLRDVEKDVPRAKRNIRRAVTRCQEAQAAPRGPDACNGSPLEPASPSE